MANLREKLQTKFDDEHRYNNYGAAIMRIHARGFRCHKDTIIDIKSPITAFCGINGTGKSTLLQLAAAAYKSVPGSSIDHFNISDFMVVGTLDPEPYAPDATVEFRYSHDYKYWESRRRDSRPTTLSYSRNSRQWSGYGRRPERRVFFTGAGHYLPKVEQRDFVVRYARHLKVLNQELFTPEVTQWTSTILGQSYDGITSNTVDYLHSSRHRQAEVVSVQLHGVEYSEAHMGYGEGRTIYLVGALEKLPEQSLILIEEPETSLHPSAQYQLGRYLLDVVNRKNHQLLLTTHSLFLLSAFHSLSIVYLKRTNQGIEPIHELSPVEVNSFLAEGKIKVLHVLVEDDCAKSILSEMIRRGDPDFLRVLDVQIGSIAATVRLLKKSEIPIVCVRDGDQEKIPKENIFSLPGTAAPEHELFESLAVAKHVRMTYGLEIQDFKTSLLGIDHHYWLSKLADRVSQERSSLLGELARVYVGALSENEITTVISLLKAAAKKKRQEHERLP